MITEKSGAVGNDCAPATGITGKYFLYCILIGYLF